MARRQLRRMSWASLSSQSCRMLFSTYTSLPADTLSKSYRRGFCSAGARRLFENFACAGNDMCQVQKRPARLAARCKEAGNQCAVASANSNDVTKLREVVRQQHRGRCPSSALALQDRRVRSLQDCSLKSSTHPGSGHDENRYL